MVAFGKLGERCGEHLQQEHRVFIERRLRTKTWRDDSGQTRSLTELYADDIIFLDSHRSKVNMSGVDEVLEP